MAGLDIEQLPALSDNYIYLVRDRETGACAAVDPAEAGPVRDALARLGWRLSHILNTHHHPDHTGANQELKAETGCRIIGAGADSQRIPGIDETVGEGDTVRLGAAQATVFDVPGHTSGHIAFWFEAERALFCGDTLFALGCGRLFEGTPAQMWSSLLKLRGLPDDARVFCAHEYTKANAAFALSIEPGNAALQARAAEVDRRRAEDRPTVPSLLADEKATNPFLRADVAATQAALGMTGEDAGTVFAEIRRRKDTF